MPTADADDLNDAARTARELQRQLPNWVRDANVPIRSLPESEYVLPGWARKVLEPHTYESLQSLLLRVRAVNEDHLGESAIEALILLAGDPATPEIRLLLRRWADAYVGARLVKTNTRDSSEAAKFDRLSKEDLLLWLDRLAHAEGTVNMQFMHEVTQYVPWLLYRGTFAHWYREEPSVGPLVCRSGFAAPTSDLADWCHKVAGIHGWHAAQKLDRVVRRLVEGGHARKPGEPDTLRDKLAELAAEIQEMRPFLIAGHNPEKCVAEVDGLSFSWSWRTFTHLGIVAVHDDLRAKIAELRHGGGSTLLVVGHDGRLACAMLPWIDIDSLDMPESTRLAANLAVVERLHARNFEVFAKIDLAAIRDRVRHQAVESTGEEPPGVEAVAATFATSESIAAEDELDASKSSSARVRFPTTTRLRPFCRLLTRLGCEVRDGHGSEVVVRRGKQSVTIGRHTSNREITSTYAQRLLRGLGVTLAEFVRVFEVRRE